MFLTSDVRERVSRLLTALCEEADLLWLTATRCDAEHDPQLRKVFARALERSVHICIEAVADVGTTLIDALIMRDAAGYEDIVAVLADEGALCPDTARALRALMRARRMLVQDAAEGDETGQKFALVRALADEAGAVARCADEIAAFVARESGLA
ncbi:MAG: DUF86 domain-containing protein, partial [Firmicutes bacterium]|nr:DUF86 domain-containing protein [Bacillota bacterium]